MSTNFPTSLDSLTNPTSTDRVDTVDHAAQHANANDALEALETKVGIDGSADTDSHDYKLSEVTSTDKSVGKVATQTLTNKTLTQPTIGDLTNSTHNHENASGGGTLNPTNALASAVPITKGGTGATTRQAGIDALTDVTNATNGQVLQKDASGNAVFAGISVDATPPFAMFNSLSSSASGIKGAFLDEFVLAVSNNATFYLHTENGDTQNRDTSSDVTSSNFVSGLVVLGDYVYVLCGQGGSSASVERYDKSDLSAGGTTMTFSGKSLSGTNTPNMTSDGTHFYLTHEAGNSANDYVISKFSLSDTTLTWVSDTNCGSTAGLFDAFAVSSDTFYGYDAADNKVRKYNSSGTLQSTTATGFANTATSVTNINNSAFYLYNTTSDLFARIFLQ